MDRIELARRAAARLHVEAVNNGHNPWRPLEFVLAEVRRRGWEVEDTRPGAPVLQGARATLMPDDWLIVYESGLNDFETASLIAHEIGHIELGDVRDAAVMETDPARPSEAAPVGLDRVTGYSRRERREVQMDLFAREFILPRAVARRLHVDEGLTAQAIAERLDAPYKVVAQQLLDALLLPWELSSEQGAEQDSPAEEASTKPLELNKVQKVAANHRGAPYLLEAGPGTGKTQTLTGRVEGLLSEGVDPRRILVLTYSNRAAGEMAERISRRHKAAAAAMWIGTFHAFGLDIVRRHAAELGLPSEPRMIDRVEAAELLEGRLARMRLVHHRNLYDPTQLVADLLSAISRAKDEVVDPPRYLVLAQQMLSRASGDAIEAAEASIELAEIYQAYEDLKRQRGRIDFGDLLAMPVQLLDTNSTVRETLQARYEHVIVDEYQDVNRASVRLLQALTNGGRGLWAVADARQSIYRFRGASSFNVGRFPADFPGAEGGRLAVNYRSQEEIVETFGAFAGGMTHAPAAGSLKAFRGASGHKPVLQPVRRADCQSAALVTAVEEMKAEGHAYRNQAILCTSNEKLSNVGRDLERSGIPVLFLGSLFERPEIKDLLSVLSLLFDGRAMGLLRTAQLPGFEMGLADVVAIQDELRRSEAAPLAWRQPKLEGLSPAGREGLKNIAEALAGFNDSARPWDVLASFLLDRTRIAADLAASNTVPQKGAAIAIWQFMNFLQAEPTTGSGQVRRLLDRVRRLVRLTDDRDLRQLPAAAQGLNAVRLMTIHGSKGLEFEVVHLPQINGDTLPGYYPLKGFLPPDGLIEGGEGAAADVIKQGQVEEKECLFYVALSRARDRLLIYTVLERVNGTKAPKSAFLDRIAPNLEHRATFEGPGLPLQPYQLPVAIEFDGSLSFSGSQIALFENCARRFFYTHILRLGGRRIETPYMLMHEAVRSVAGKIISGELPAESEQARAALRSACQSVSLNEHAQLDDFLEIAAELIDYLLQARIGVQAVEVDPLRVAFDADIIITEIDDAHVDRDGVKRFRRIRTGHKRSTELKDLGAAAFVIGAQQSGTDALIEVIHLADRQVHPIKLSPTELKNRSTKLRETLLAIRSGAFAPDPSERTCPGCPAFFVCGELPKGSLQRKM